MTAQAPDEARTNLATPAEVAEFLGVPELTLTQWRYRKTGPRYSRVGKYVRYRWSDIETWLEQRTIRPARTG